MYIKTKLNYYIKNIHENLFPVFKVDDVNFAINKLNNLVGPHNIHTFHLENTPESIRLYLCKL